MGSEEDPFDSELGFQVMAATLRAGSEQVEGFVTSLADRLERAIPGRVKVELARRWGVGPRKVDRIEVWLDPDRYTLHSRSGQLEARIAHQVRGIVVRTDEVGIDLWLESLSRALVELANRNMEARVSIERLFR